MTNKKRRQFPQDEDFQEEMTQEEFAEDQSDIYDDDSREYDSDEYGEDGAEYEEYDSEEYDEEYEEEAPEEYDDEEYEEEAPEEYDEEYEEEVPEEYDDEEYEEEASEEYDDEESEDKALEEYDDEEYEEEYDEEAPEEYDDGEYEEETPEENDTEEDEEEPQPVPVSEEPDDTASQKSKSARPRPVMYVPIDDDEMQIPEIPGKKGRFKGLKITGVAALMIVAAAGCAYAGASYYYMDKFFEGTTINGIDCSGKTPFEVEQLIAQNVNSYSIQVASRNLEPQVIEGSKIDYQYVSGGEVLKLQQQQKPYEWILGFVEERSYTITENVTYNKELLQDQILQLNCAQPENQIAPENAYVTFSGIQFEIVPETQGSELNVKQAYQIVDSAISGKQAAVDFTENSDAYVPASVTSTDPGLQATLNACNNFTKASITYLFGDAAVTLDGSTIKDWLQFDEKGQYVQDDASFQQHVKDFVAQLAAQYDTVGTDREFYTTSGRTVYVHGYNYGWKIDQEKEAAQLTQEIQSGTQVSRDPVYSSTANSRGINDLGNTYIEVDLSDQHMYYYQNGSVIFESDIVSGNMSYSDRQTPPGIFTLYYKKSPDVLRGSKKEDGTYEYEQPVQYWMPFNGGIGFHDADWQPYFGGDRYLYGGSHGCINLPPYKAAELYNIIQYGVPIICFY